MPACVHYQRHDDIGVIRIDNPPVNALGHAVRSGLLTALYRAATAAPDDRCTAMEAASLPLAEQGLCDRTSDIDLLAVEALGYPRHLGGPHRQASLNASATSETSP